MIVLVDILLGTAVRTAMIEPEVTGSGVEDGAEDDEEVVMGPVKVRTQKTLPKRVDAWVWMWCVCVVQLLVL